MTAGFNKPIDPATRKRIREEWLKAPNGFGLEIAKRVGLSESSVNRERQRMAKEGLLPPSTRSKPRPVTTERVERIKRMLADGYRVRQIADTLGLSITYVSSLSRQFKVKVPAAASIRLRRFDSMRIIQNSAALADGLVPGIEMVDDDYSADIEPQQAALLLGQLRGAIHALKKIEGILKRSISDGVSNRGKQQPENEAAQAQ